MTVQIVIGLAAVMLFAFLLGRGSKPKPPRETQDDRVKRIREEDEARDAKIKADHLAVWLPIMERLPIVDMATTPELHSPIYDCVSDGYELPCAHSSYDAGYSRVFMGMPFGQVSQAELRQTLTNFSSYNDNMAAFVDGGDCAYLLYTDTTREPGSKVQRYVRTGPDAYQAYGWRSGMDPSAGKDDPGYFVRDIAANPQLWVRRMQILRHQQWPLNAYYLSTQRQCAHR